MAGDDSLRDTLTGFDREKHEYEASTARRDPRTPTPPSNE
jgi:hypothetical protein